MTDQFLVNFGHLQRLSALVKHCGLKIYVQNAKRYIQQSTDSGFTCNNWIFYELVLKFFEVDNPV